MRDKPCQLHQKEKHREKEGYAKSGTKEDEPVTQLDKLQNDLLSVVSTKRELFSATNFESPDYVGNSLTLDILHQLLLYVKGLMRVEKPEVECARISCSEMKLLSVNDSSFKKMLKIFYDLKNMIMHLFLALEDESLAGIKEDGYELKVRSVSPFVKPQGEPLKVVSKLHELFGSTPTKSEVTSYVSNSLTLDILLQLLVYVKGLIGVEKPESIIARTSCVESILVMQWLNEEDSNFKKLLKRLYRLEDILMHLFLVLEVECLAGIQRRLEDNSYKLGDELHLRKTQEYTSVLASAKVWDIFLQSGFKSSMTVILHLLLSMSIEKGTELTTSYNEQDDIKEEPPDQRIMKKQTHLFITALTNGKVWKILLRSDHNFSKATIIHLLLSLSVEQGTGLIKRCNGQRNVKDKPPDPRRYEHKLEICASAMVWCNLLESDLNFSMNTIMHLILSLSVGKGTGLIKSTQGREGLSKTSTIFTSAKVRNKLFKSDFDLSMTTIKHLILFLSFEEGLGLIQGSIGPRNVKENPPDQEEPKDSWRLKLEDFPREHKYGTSNQWPELMSVNDITSLDGASPDVIQLKEEPPGLPNSESFRGKLLNPYMLQWTNLLYLCVGDQVLRSKLFEEGGYDEDMTSTNLDQLAQEESTPTGPAHILEEATEPATHGNKRRDFNPTGKLIQLSAALGNFTRYLASHGEPLPDEDNSYRIPETTCLLYPYHPGNPPGEDLATHGDSIQTLATHGNSSTDLGGTYRAFTMKIHHLPHSHHLLAIFSRYHHLTAFLPSHLIFTSSFFSPPVHHHHYLPYSPSHQHPSLQMVTISYHHPLSIIITLSLLHLITLSPTAIILASLSPLSLFPHITITSRFHPPFTSLICSTIITLRHSLPMIISHHYFMPYSPPTATISTTISLSIFRSITINS